MPTNSSVAAAIGADDALNADLLDSFRDTGMYDFASEFDIIQDPNGMEDDRDLPGGIPMMGGDDAMMGDLPRLAVKSDPSMMPGSPFRGGGLRDNDLIGKNAVTAAAAAVQETRRRMDSAGAGVGNGVGGGGGGGAGVGDGDCFGGDPSSPPPALVKRGSAPMGGGAPAPSSRAAPSSSQRTPANTDPPGSSAKRRKTGVGGAAGTGAGAGGGTGAGASSAGGTGTAGTAPPSTGGGTDNKDKSGKGLRHFSMKVCEKVESKQTTTYNEVADELVAEFSNPDDPNFCADQAYDEKNIRRRVYDALNVLMAMNIITKEKKEIMWKGLPTTTESDVEHLRAEKAKTQAQIEKKNAYLQELVVQYKSYQALLQRNAARTAAGVVPSGIQLPFILVQTKPQATVEVEISEDQQVVHFDFNSTPFQIHDGNFVLANMNLGDSLANMNLGGDGGGAGVSGGVGGAGGADGGGGDAAEDIGAAAAAEEMMALEDVVRVGGGGNQQSAAAAKWSRKGKAVEGSGGGAGGGREQRVTRGVKAEKR